MRIVFVARADQGPGVVGGVQSYLRRLASGLKTVGHEVVFELIGDAPGPKLARCHKDASAAIGAALEREPDVLQATSGLGPKAVARHLTGWHRVEHRLGAHFVHPPRPSVATDGVMTKASAAAFWAAYRGTYTNSLVPSPRLRDAVKGWGRPILVPPPARADHFEITRPVAAAEVRFGYAGRLAVDKGVGDAVAAFDALVKAYPGRCTVEFFGYGDAGDAALLERRDYVRLTRLDKLPAWSPERSLALSEFLGRIDVLVLPYRDLLSTVDVPLLVVEGMAAGCAVVSTAVGDVPWVLGPSAPVVGTGDAGALRDVLETFIQEPAKARDLGRTLRARAREWGLTPEGAARTYLKGLGA